MTYKIVRFRYGGTRPDGHLKTSRRTIKTGLTLEEAQAHCQHEDTHGDGWFDGYMREGGAN